MCNIYKCVMSCDVICVTNQGWYSRGHYIRTELLLPLYIYMIAEVLCSLLVHRDYIGFRNFFLCLKILPQFTTRTTGCCAKLIFAGEQFYFDLSIN